MAKKEEKKVEKVEKVEKPNSVIGKSLNVMGITKKPKFEA